MKVIKVLLLEPKMEQDLVRDWHHASFLEQALEFSAAEVRDPDCVDFAKFEAFLHCFIRVNVIDVSSFGLAVVVLGKEFVAAGEG